MSGHATDYDPGVGVRPIDEKAAPKSKQGPVEGRAVFDADAEEIIKAIERAVHPRASDLQKTPPEHPRGAAELKDSRLPGLKLPGFGEPRDNCSEFDPAAGRFCQKSGKYFKFKRNCVQYDCPDHAPYAIRRRAAGSSDGSGVVPQLKSLILRLYNERDVDHYFHHLFISPPDDFLTESNEPLERSKDVVRDIMDELGIQGLVAYHPFRSENEEPDKDDRGFWKDFLFQRSDWGRARDELEYGPHFHIIGVAPEVDVSVTEEIEEETGWVIHRRVDDDTGKSLENDRAMARAATYCLSHAMIYNAGESDERYLAAWMKGPDVHSTKVFPKVKSDMSELVHEVAEDTLGIAAPDLSCDCDYHRHVQDGEPVDPIGDGVGSGAVTMADLWSRTPETAKGGTGGDDRDMGVDPDDELPYTNRTELPNNREVLPDRDSSSTSSKSSSTSSGTSNAPSDDVDEDYQDCGAYLKHISQAGEYLLDDEWRRQAPYVDDLEDHYSAYVEIMKRRNLDPLEEPDKLPEERDDPPPD